MHIYNGDDSVLQQCDIVCSHFIVIEGLNHTKKKSKGAGSFVECTVAKLPSVQALSTSSNEGHICS